ncbi:MAG: RIP metalloprotease RseP [Desulfatitalea sp.]|nr:RIP metalloprotease RseP [Desulfatitalea sp.]
MSSVLIFIVVLGVLIFFHELGHFLVARLFGVGVERFSLGFGPRLFGRTVGRTDYRVSAIPLGGYVKMVGEEPDAPLPPEDLPYSFTHKPVGKRALIVFAGPLFNILLALVIFTAGLFIAGLPSIRPVVRTVESDGPARQAGIQEGDLIQAIDGQKVSSWRDIEAAADESQGDPLRITVLRQDSVLEVTVQPKPATAKNLLGDTVTYNDLGIKGYAAPHAMVDGVIDGLPAAEAGLQQGDRIVAIDGQPIDAWEQMQEMVAASKGKPLVFTIQREDQVFDASIAPAEIQETDLLGIKQSVYRIGIRGAGVMIPETDRVTVRLGPLDAVGMGAGETWRIIRITGHFFVKMFQRQVGSEAIGGPIRIAQMANQQAQEGLLALLYFIAIISVNLAVINLLPVPVLDGGHLLFFAIEAVKGKPVSVRTRETAQQVGMFLLLLLMVFVFYNDIVITWFR